MRGKGFIDGSMSTALFGGRFNSLGKPLRNRLTEAVQIAVPRCRRHWPQDRQRTACAPAIRLGGQQAASNITHFLVRFYCRRRRIGGGHYRSRRCRGRSEEHTSELQSLMRISYAVFCLKKKKQQKNTT